MATFDEFYNSLNTDSNVRGYEFEKIFVPWFLKTDPLWANQIDGVWLWDDYPKRSEWGPDNGVDIILHHSKGLGTIAKSLGMSRSMVQRIVRQEVAV